MKIYIKCIIAVWAAITGFSANAAFTYNPNDNTLTGGGGRLRRHVRITQQMNLMSSVQTVHLIKRQENVKLI